MDRVISIPVIGQKEIPLRDGVLHIGPLPVSGTLRLEPLRRDGEDDSNGLLDVQFQWNLRDGQCARYSSLIDVRTLLPHDRVTRFAPTPASGSFDFACHTTIDSRDPFSIAIEGDAPLKGRWKYVGVTFFMKIDNSDLLIHISIWTNDQRAVGEQIVLQYRLPFEIVMWRNAPLIGVNDIMTENEPWVHVDVSLPALPDVPISTAWIEKRASSVHRTNAALQRKPWPRIVRHSIDATMPADTILKVRGGTVDLKRGTVPGLLSIDTFEKRGCKYRMGQIDVIFEWNMRGGVSARYRSVIDLKSLLPWNRSTRIVSAPSPGSWDYATAMSIDSRDSYSFAVDGQAPITGVWMINTVSGYFFLSESGLRIRIAFGTSDPRADRGLITLEYMLPFYDLLWRKAPKFVSSDIVAEAEEWVDVEFHPDPIPELPLADATYVAHDR